MTVWFSILIFLFVTTDTERIKPSSTSLTCSKICRLMCCLVFSGRLPIKSLLFGVVQGREQEALLGLSPEKEHEFRQSGSLSEYSL